METTKPCVPEEVAKTAGVSVEEVKEWLQKVRHYHQAGGHPTNRNLTRMMAEAKLPEWKLKIVSEFHCDDCAALKPGGKSSGQIPVASTRPLPRAWAQVGADMGEWTVIQHHKKLKFALYIDLATKFKAMDVVTTYGMYEMETESG